MHSTLIINSAESAHLIKLMAYWNSEDGNEMALIAKFNFIGKVVVSGVYIILEIMSILAVVLEIKDMV